MRTNKKLFGIGLLLMLCWTIGRAQDGTFKSDEGFTWGMSKQEVQKIKVDNPLSLKENQIMYSDLMSGSDAIFNFVDDKLVDFTNIYNPDKKKFQSTWDQWKKKLTEMYGEPVHTYPATHKKAQPTYVFNFKGTEIELRNLIDNEVRIFYKKL